MWIINLNVKHNTIKLLKDSIGENLDDHRFGSDFLETMPLSMKEKFGKLDLIKMRN